MKKIILGLGIALSVTFSAKVEAQTSVYQDSDGDRYETRQTRVWVSEQRVGGIFGVGGRTIPGHYEMREEQVRVNDDEQYSNGASSSKGWEGKHPHGMPPGQRKKLNRGEYQQGQPDREYGGDSNKQNRRQAGKKQRGNSKRN